MSYKFLIKFISIFVLTCHFYFDIFQISDDSDCYTPLERPPTYSATAVPPNRFAKIIESESDEEPEPQSSSDSDSDLDAKRKKPKKAKLKIKPKVALGVNPKHKKYDIWSTRMQEDVLSETLNSCDVTLKDRSRDVESYDYTLSYSYNNDTKICGTDNKFTDTRTNNKRTRNDRKNTNLRLKQKQEDNQESKGAARSILDLAVTSEDSLDDIVKDIANKLLEEKEDLVSKYFHNKINAKFVKILFLRNHCNSRWKRYCVQIFQRSTKN